MKKEIKQYKSNRELNLEKIVNDYSSYISKIIENMASYYLSK